MCCLEVTVLFCSAFEYIQRRRQARDDRSPDNVIRQIQIRRHETMSVMHSVRFYLMLESTAKNTWRSFLLSINDIWHSILKLLNLK